MLCTCIKSAYYMRSATMRIYILNVKRNTIRRRFGVGPL